MGMESTNPYTGKRGTRTYGPRTCKKIFKLNND